MHVKKGEYAIVLDHQYDNITTRYIGQKVLVDEDSIAPWCVCPDGERHAFSQSKLKPDNTMPDNTMKDFYLNVPNNEFLRKAVQEHAFALGYKWGDGSGTTYITYWCNDFIYTGLNKTIRTCSETCVKNHGYKKISLHKFFELKPEECTDKVRVICEDKGFKKEVWLSRESAKALNLIDKE